MNVKISSSTNMQSDTADEFVTEIQAKKMLEKQTSKHHNLWSQIVLNKLLKLCDLQNICVRALENLDTICPDVFRKSGI